MLPLGALLHGLGRTQPQGWLSVVTLWGTAQRPKPFRGSQPSHELGVWLCRPKALEEVTIAAWALNLTSKPLLISAGYADALFSHGLKSIREATLHSYYSSCNVTPWASAFGEWSLRKKYPVKPMEVSSQRKLSPQRPFRTITYLWWFFLLGKTRGTLSNSRNFPKFMHNLA